MLIFNPYAILKTRMGQALYRKYRSRSLQELVGQEHVTQTLDRAIKAGRISHAYLFTGPRGVGKTSVARILAHEINGLPYSDTPHLDIIEIDAASNRRIDDIRDLRDKVYIAPTSAKYKVYIIDEVHMLTGESFNALLKTLEEPPAHVVFILATTEVHKLPATIISRTQRFAFRPGAPDKVAAHLRTIADKEQIKIDDDALALIAEHGDGSFRDSVSLLDQVTNAATDKITADDVAATLGLAPNAKIQSLVQAMTAGDRAAIAATLTELAATGANTSTLVAQLSKAVAVAAQAQPHLYAVVDGLLDVPRAYNPDLKLLTVLMRAAPVAAPAPKTAPALVAAPATIASAPVVKQKPAAKPTVKKEEPPDAPAEVPAGKPLTSFDNLAWHKVLAAVKKARPPLFSVAKQAQPVFDASTNELTLLFKFALHRKKLDDVKQKAALTHIFITELGGAPTIKTDVSADAQAPGPPPADPTLANVAKIMGGGEIIDA